jgi:predicted trehalose synthase
VTQEVESARTNPQWYREAVIYQAHVRASLDSTPDVVIDFPDLTSRLGYLRLDRSLRELDGELKNGMEWISIPLNGLMELPGLR